MSLISVILPVYNGEKTILQTIESVLNQTHSELELLIINDGSTDTTLKIISNIHDSRLKVFSYTNSGVSASRNRGIENSIGEYISFIDADDLWKLDKLEMQLSALLSNPQAAVAYSWTDWIDESGKFLRSGGHITVNGNVYEQLLLKDFVESGSNPLIRRQALIEVGGFDASLSPAEDWDMWLRLAAKYQFVAVPLTHILYRICYNSASSNVWKMETASLKIIERAFQNNLESIQQNKQQVLNSRYKYLTFKALEGVTERKKGLVATRFLAKVISTDYSLLLRPKLMLVVVLKIAISILLPPKQAEAFLTMFKRISKKQP